MCDEKPEWRAGQLRFETCQVWGPQSSPAGSPYSSFMIYLFPFYGNWCSSLCVCLCEGVESLEEALQTIVSYHVVAGS